MGVVYDLISLVELGKIRMVWWWWLCVCVYVCPVSESRGRIAMLVPVHPVLSCPASSSMVEACWAKAHPNFQPGGETKLPEPWVRMRLKMIYEKDCTKLRWASATWQPTGYVLDVHGGGGGRKPGSPGKGKGGACIDLGMAWGWFAS